MIAEVIYFTHELDMLEAHLEEHHNFVDEFIIKESRVFWSGVKKPLLFTENKSRFSKYNVKVMEVPVSEFEPIPRVFAPEEFKKWYDARKRNRQRSRTYRWDDIKDKCNWVLSTDTDEIIDSRRFHLLESIMTDGDKEHIAIRLKQSQYWVNTPASTISIYRVFRGDVPHRAYVKGRPRCGTPTIGWHFTNCFKTGEELYNKAVGISTHYSYCGVEAIPEASYLENELKKGRHPFRDRWIKGKLQPSKQWKNSKPIVKNILSREDRSWAPKLMRDKPELFPWYEEAP